MAFATDSIDLGKHYASVYNDPNASMYELWESVFDAGGLDYSLYGTEYDSFGDIWENFSGILEGVDYNPKDLTRMSREDRLNQEQFNLNFANEMSTTNQAISQSGLTMGGGFMPLSQSDQAYIDEGKKLSSGIKMGRRNYFEGIGNQIWDSYSSIIDAIETT